MTFRLDTNTLLAGCVALGLAWCGRTLWQTAVIVERLDERTAQHSMRITRLEAAKENFDALHNPPR